MNETRTLGHFIAQLPKPTALLDTSYNIICVSNSWLSYFEIAVEDIKETSLLDFFEASGKKFNKHYLVDSISEIAFGTNSIITKNGTEKYFEYSCSPWLDEYKNIKGITVQIDDITVSLDNKLQLEKIEHLINDQSEIAKVGIWEYDFVNDALKWSKMTRKIHEVSLDFEVQLDSAITFFKQGHSQNTMAMCIHDGLERGKEWSERLKLITAKGKEKWVIAAGKPIYFNGAIKGLIGTIQDITDQVQQEIRVKENEKLLRTLVDNLPLNLYIKDKDSRKLLVNRAECNFMGVQNPKALLGKSDFDLFDKEVAQISRDEDLHVFRTRSPIIAKRTVSITAKGEPISFLISKIPLINLDGECSGLIGISLDITEISNKENQLKDLVNIAAVQNKKLISFAHIVSHNLRSHTANLSMLTNFLTTEKRESERKSILKMLEQESEKLMEALENLNKVVEINTNINLEKKTINLNEQIKRVKQSLSTFLKKNNATITNTISNTVYVNAVPSYLENIILNLLTNAIKYKHPKRKPHIKLSTIQKDNQLIFSVTDNGLGIDLERHGSQLFGMYKTFHEKPDSRGMGLYFIKNQIEAMGGSIIACSEVNKGTTFRIYFKNED